METQLWLNVRRERMNTLTCVLDVHQKQIEAFDLFNLEIICMYVDFFPIRSASGSFYCPFSSLMLKKVKSELLWS